MAEIDQIDTARVYTVGLVASHRSWRTELTRHVQDHTTGLKVKVIRDPRTVDDGVDVVVIDDSSTFLDRESLRRLIDVGVGVIGIYDPGERHGRGQAYLTELGINDVASAELSPVQLVELIRTITDNDTRTYIDLREAGSSQTGTPTVSTPTTNSPTPTARGAVVTIGGPLRSQTVEFTVALSAEIARQSRQSVVAVDLDETTPLLAPRLGYRLEPTVLDAVERLEGGDGDLRLAITKPTHGARGFCPMHVMAGIANPDDWALIGRDRVENLLAHLSTQWSYVVTSSGPNLGQLPNGVERFGASRQAIVGADLVVGVIDPTPLGVLQGLDWMIEVRGLTGGRPVWIVFAGRPRSSAQRADLAEALNREAGNDLIMGTTFVPMGAEVSRAVWEGRIVERGPFSREIGDLVADLVEVPGPAEGARFGSVRARTGASES